MKRILFIAEYLLSFPGGAERSIYEELKLLAKKNTVVCHTFDSYFKKGTFRQDNMIIYNHALKNEFSLSRFIEIKKNIEFITSKLDCIDVSSFDYCITQSLIAPKVATFCVKNKLPFHYYIRDELQLNEFHNYEKGVRHLLKKIKDLMELSTISVYQKENLFALNSAQKIVANSKFMHDLLDRKYKLKSTIKEPNIDVSVFKNVEKDPTYILFLGAKNNLKGYGVAKKIANYMSKEQFVFVGRNKLTIKKNNITYLPWQKDVAKLYAKAKLVLIPSRWQEAYCRTVIDAKMLDIPVVTSIQGNLTNFKDTYKVKDLENIDLWVKTVKEALSKK